MGVGGPKDVEGALDGDAHGAVPILHVLGERREVEDGGDAAEGRGDRVEIGDVGLEAGNAVHRTAVEGAEVVRVAKLGPGEPPDQAAGAGDEHLRLLVV
jgi:hypothetical protein